MGVKRAQGQGRGARGCIFLKKGVDIKNRGGDMKKERGADTPFRTMKLINSLEFLRKNDCKFLQGVLQNEKQSHCFFLSFILNFKGNNKRCNLRTKRKKECFRKR